MVGQSAHELWREFNPVNSSKAQLILAKEIGFVHSANAAPKRAQDHEVWHQADKPLSDAFNRCSLILHLGFNTDPFSNNPHVRSATRHSRVPCLSVAWRLLAHHGSPSWLVLPRMSKSLDVHNSSVHETVRQVCFIGNAPNANKRAWSP